MKQQLLVSLLLVTCLMGCGQNQQPSNIDQASKILEEVNNNGNSSPVLVSIPATEDNNEAPITAMPTSEFDFTAIDESIPGGQAQAHVSPKERKLDIALTQFSSAPDVSPSTSDTKSITLSQAEWDLFAQVFGQYDAVKQAAQFDDSAPLLANMNECNMYYLLEYLYSSDQESEYTPEEYLKMTLEAFANNRIEAQEYYAEEAKKENEKQEVTDLIAESKKHKVSNIELYVWDDFWWDNMDTLTYMTFTPNGSGATMSYKCYGITEDTGERCHDDDFGYDFTIEIDQSTFDWVCGQVLDEYEDVMNNVQYNSQYHDYEGDVNSILKYSYTVSFEDDFPTLHQQSHEFIPFELSKNRGTFVSKLLNGTGMIELIIAKDQGKSTP